MNINLNKLQSSLTGVLFTNVQSIKNTYKTLQYSLQSHERGDTVSKYDYFVMLQCVRTLTSDIEIFKMLTNIIDIKTVDLLPTTCNYDIQDDIEEMEQLIKHIEEKYIYVKHQK
tara:strand:+ start:1230 stop:1571 length:342 start_codon:yes stop_codon:yes gene_type:complete